MSTCQGDRKAGWAGRNGAHLFRGVTGGAAAGLLAGCAALLALGGCPPTGGVDDDDVDPPIVPAPTEFNVEITSTQGILQFNALGLDALFQRSSTLQTQVTGPGLPESGFTVEWSIQAPSGAASVLAFGVAVGAASQTATGASVDVTVVSDPAVDVDQVISATVTLLDSGAVLPTERLTIRIIPDSGADTTVLESNPFATPAVGLDASSQVVLNAGVSGNVRAFAVNWEAVSALPSGISLPDPATGETLALDVTAPVSGVFSFRCTVTDSNESVAVGVVNVFLGQAAIALDVVVTRLNVSPAAPSIGIRTTRVGGGDDLADNVNGPFTYSFQVLRDDGTDVSSSASISPDPSTPDDDAVNDWTITGITTPGTYRILVTVSDGAELLTGAGSVTVSLGDVYSLDVRSTDIVLAPGETATLTFDRTGGTPNFSYSFTETSPGADSGSFGSTSPVSATNDGAVSWTAPSAPGAGAVEGVYVIDVTASDANGFRTSDSISILVQENEPLSLDVRASANIVSPGGTVTLTLDQSGGVGSYSYAFSVTGPNAGSSFGDPSPKTAAGDTTTTWTAPAASATTEGAYRIDVEVTDALGNTFRDSDVVVVQTDVLSLDTQVIVTQVVPGGSGANLASTFRTGGIAAFSYAWRALDEAGNNDIALFGGQPTSAGSEPQLTWSFSSVPAVANAGTYRLECTVTDGDGNTFVSSSEILVSASGGGGGSLSLDTQVIVTRVVPGGSGANLASTFRTGGVAAFSYAWRALDESGNDDIALFGGQPTSAGSEPELTWSFSSVPAVANAGTYRLECTVTDGEGTTFVSSSEILISADPLSLDTQVIVTRVVPGGSGANLASTFRTGGIAAFSYNWRALDQANNDDIALFGGQPTSAGSEPELTWSFSSVPGVGNVGTYRLECTVTDGEGTTFVSSSEVLIAGDPLSVDVDATSLILAPMMPVRITTDVFGGTANFDYAWSATDPQSNAVGAASFSQTSNTNTASTSEVVDFLPPTNPSGTYRFVARVTDDVAQVVEQTLHLWVTDDTELVNGDRFDNAADTQDAGELGTNNGDILGAATTIPTGETRMVLEAASLDTSTLTHARNLVFLLDDNNNGGELDVTDILITGTNARGDTIQDSFDPVDDGFTAANWPFKTITNIALTYSGAQANDSIQIGVGDRFGLSAKFPASTNALHIVATTTPAFDPSTNAITFIDPDSGDLTVNLGDALDLPTTDQQHLIFATDVPDNTRDYAVQVGPSNPVISLDVSASDYDLDFSDGDTAVITMDVTGGAAPYTFTYSTVGLTETGSFAIGGAGPGPFSLGPFAGDVMDTWAAPDLVTPALPPEIHALVVQVVDANGDAATGQITIRVQQ